MNKLILSTVIVFGSFNLLAQWNPNGSTIIATMNKVGIGTTTPGQFFDSNQTAAPSYTPADNVLTVYASTSRPIVEFARPVTSLAAGELLGALYFSNADGQSDQHKQVAGIWAMRSSYTAVPSLAGASLVFMTKADGAGTQNKMYFDQSGNLGIGTSNTHGYKLAVYGKAIAEEVNVSLYGNWPDYVFSDTYKLQPLSELSVYLNKNRHLPGLPTASEVAKDGINLGEMNTALVEKIEELTLYLIELEKKNRDLEARILQLETKN